jgi:hypothetical protein
VGNLPTTKQWKLKVKLKIIVYKNETDETPDYSFEVIAKQIEVSPIDFNSATAAYNVPDTVEIKGNIVKQSFRRYGGQV